MPETEKSTTINSLAQYLEARKNLICSREAFLAAVKAYLHPGNLVDAEVLGDTLHCSKARSVSEDYWVINAVRGYLTILAAPAQGRLFRLSVLQAGQLLRISITAPSEIFSPLTDANKQVFQTFSDNNPICYPQYGTEMVVIDWTFDASKLYDSVQNFETGLYRVSAIFENALQALNPVDFQKTD
jgi:hypothetical protein